MNEVVTEIKPGRAYVIELDGVVSKEQVQRIQTEWIKRCPGAGIVILTNGIKLHRSQKSMSFATAVCLWIISVTNLVIAVLRWIF